MAILFFPETLAFTVNLDLAYEVRDDGGWLLLQDCSKHPVRP